VKVILQSSLKNEWEQYPMRIRETCERWNEPGETIARFAFLNPNLFAFSADWTTGQRLSAGHFGLLDDY